MSQWQDVCFVDKIYPPFPESWPQVNRVSSDKTRKRFLSEHNIESNSVVAVIFSSGVHSERPYLMQSLLYRDVEGECHEYDELFGSSDN